MEIDLSKIPKPRPRGRPRKVITTMLTSSDAPQITDSGMLDFMKTKVQQLEEELAKTNRELALKKDDSMQRSLQFNKLLSSDEMESMQQRRQQLMSELSNDTVVLQRLAGRSQIYAKTGSTEDKIRILEELKKVDITLQKNGIPEVDAKTKDKMVVRRKELEAIIREAYPPKSVCTRNYKDPNFDSGRFNDAVHQIVKAEQTIGHLVREWQNICKILEPQNPQAGNVERIKKD
jgi:hypothetical protein